MSTPANNDTIGTSPLRAVLVTPENWDHLNVASRWRVCPYDLLTSIAQCTSGGASPPSRTVLLFITTFVITKFQLEQGIKCAMIFDCQYQPFGTHQFSLFHPLEFLARALLSRLEGQIVE